MRRISHRSSVQSAYNVGTLTNLNIIISTLPNVNIILMYTVSILNDPNMCTCTCIMYIVSTNHNLIIIMNTISLSLSSVSLSLSKNYTIVIGAILELVIRHYF